MTHHKKEEPLKLLRPDRPFHFPDFLLEPQEGRRERQDTEDRRNNTRLKAFPNGDKTDHMDHSSFLEAAGKNAGQDFLQKVRPRVFPDRDRTGEMEYRPFPEAAEQSQNVDQDFLQMAV